MKQFIYLVVLLFIFVDGKPCQSNNHVIPKESQVSNAHFTSQTCDTKEALKIRGGGWIIPAGWNPFGYKITALGEEFLKFDGSLDSDVGRFLASLKAARKRKAVLKAAWLEIVRAAKTGQAMRIYRSLDDLIKFCLSAGLID